MNGWQPRRERTVAAVAWPTGHRQDVRAAGADLHWRHSCEPHYIVDPQIFFGERPDYMLEVLLNEPDEGGIELLESDRGRAGGEERPLPWRLLILEDTGEMLAADAKEREGQGLSMLLNVVDGLIGQGLRALLLVTGMGHFGGCAGQSRVQGDVPQ